MRGPRRMALLLAAWTVFVWVTRIRNVVGDDDLSNVGRTQGLLLSGSFLALAAIAAAAVLAGHERRRAVVALLALWTVAVWVVRSAQIATSDHGVGFIVVHLVLGVVSVALAVLAVRAPIVADRGSS